MNIQNFLEIYNRYTEQFDFDTELEQNEIFGVKCLMLNQNNFDVAFYFDDECENFYIASYQNKFGNVNLSGEFDSSNCLELLIYLFDFI